MTKNWVLRGLVFAAGMLIVRMIQGVLINTTPVDPTLISLALLVVFIAAVVGWAYLDGRADAKAQHDPDRRTDLAMTWLLAGIVTGVLSGALAWLIALVEPAIYTGGLISELTTFASFTALVVFVPAVAAVALGRWQIDRTGVHVPQRHHGLAADPTTDVFAAVDADSAATATANATDAADAAAALDEAPTTVLTLDPQAAEVTEATEVTETIGVTEATEVIETAETTEATEATEVTEVITPADASESTKPTEKP